MVQCSLYGQSRINPGQRTSIVFILYPSIIVNFFVPAFAATVAFPFK